MSKHHPPLNGYRVLIEPLASLIFKREKPKKPAGPVDYAPCFNLGKGCEKEAVYGVSSFGLCSPCYLRFLRADMLRRESDSKPPSAAGGSEVKTDIKRLRKIKSTLSDHISETWADELERAAAEILELRKRVKKLEGEK